MTSVNQLLRTLPKVGSLLDDPQWVAVQSRYSREQVKAALEIELGKARQEIRSGDSVIHNPNLLLIRVEQRLACLTRVGPWPVLNATGVIIHTNLGRAPLAQEAVSAALGAMGYCNLEMDMDSGERGSRHTHVEELACRLSGAQAAMVVNNNAAAVLLALGALAHGREGVISRGQLVEIGGSFRIPAVMEQSGVRLVEVGTTNKTYLEDYRQAITADTGVLLRVHPSNYRVVGFHQEVSLGEMVTLGREYGLPVLDDLGSGTLVDLRPWGIDEPTVGQSIAAGADLVCFSGDKLLGGPQCGLIVGSSLWISRLKKHPLARALRCDKVTLAALAATLSLYISPEGWRRIPVLAMLTEDLARVRERAEGLAKALIGLPAVVEVLEDISPIGGGALPLHRLPTRVVRIEPREISAQDLAMALRLGSQPLMARIRDEAVLLDVRTLTEQQVKEAAAAIVQVLGGGDHE
jgi:L-seryl-tRNA(Ser) seleniumtransferase